MFHTCFWVQQKCGQQKWALSGSSGSHALPGRVGSSDSSGDGNGGGTKDKKSKPKKEPKKKAKKVTPFPDDDHDPIDDHDDDSDEHGDGDELGSDVLESERNKKPIKRPAAAKRSTKKPASKTRKRGEDCC